MAIALLAAYNAAMRALVVVLLLTVGCSCDHGEPVPFGLNGQRGDVIPADPTATAPPPAPDAPIEAREWPEGATVTLEGATLTIPGAVIRATLSTDLDHDGDVDALLAALGPTGPLLFSVVRDGVVFSAPAPIAWTDPGPFSACPWSRVAFVANGAEATLLSLDRDCPDPALPEPPMLDVTKTLVVRLDARPRVLETFQFAHAGSDHATPTLADRDGDGHDDVVFAVSVDTAADGPATGELVYLDRPAGLSRDTSQPESSIAGALAFERPVARRHPDRLLAGARRAIALHEALCGVPSRMAVGGSSRLSCDPSAAVGQAFVVVAAASARAGETLAALDALDALDPFGVTVRDVDRTLAGDAVRAMRGILAPPAHDGPEAHPISTTSEQRLGTLAFVDEDHVRIRGQSQSVVLSTGEVTPDADASETRLRDPGARFRLVDLHAGCGGPDLLTASIGIDLSVGGAQRVIPATARPPVACGTPAGPPVLRLDGLHVLGWAPQGILLARGVTLTLVPLDIDAQPAGEPMELPLDAPPPAPIAAGHATTDASAWALGMSAGIVVFRRAEQDARLVRPTGFTRTEGTTIDVAISPSAERIAWIENGHLRWAVLSEPTPPPTPATPTE